MKNKGRNRAAHDKSHAENGLHHVASRYLEEELRARQRALIVELSVLDGWNEVRLSAELQQAAELDVNELGLMSLLLFKQFQQVGLARAAVHRTPEPAPAPG